MPRVAVLSIIVATTVAVMVIMLVNRLSMLDAPFMARIDVLAISHGRIHELLGLGETWSYGPSRLPHPSSFLNIDAVMTTACLVLLGVRILRRCNQWSYVNLGKCVLVGEFALYLTGFAWLALGNTPIQYCGVWLAWMLIGLFYGAVLCFGCGVAELLASRRAAVKSQTAAILTA